MLLNLKKKNNKVQATVDKDWQGIFKSSPIKDRKP